MLLFDAIKHPTPTRCAGIRTILILMCALAIAPAGANAKGGSSIIVTTTAGVAGSAVSGTVAITNTTSKTQTVSAIKVSLEVRFPSGHTPPSLPAGSTSGWYMVASMSLPNPATVAANQTINVPYSFNTCAGGVAAYGGAKDMRTAATVKLAASGSQPVSARSPNFPLPGKCPVCGNGILETGEQCDQGYNGGACCATTCQYRPNGTTCSDGSACTQADQCQAGTCLGGSPVTCSASDQCHTAGTCNPASGLCSNPSKLNGSACSDGNACTQNDSCQSGTCRGSSAVTCPALDQCHVGTCDAQTGLCSNVPKADGTECIDGDACSVGDACVGGECASGTARDCNDHMTCTDDVCSEATGCSHTDAATCDMCDGTECAACGEACDAAASSCADNCWATFWTCLNGCTTTYCAPFCQADLGQCLNICPASEACWAQCETGNGCAAGCVEP